MRKLAVQAGMLCHERSPILLRLAVAMAIFAGALLLRLWLLPAGAALAFLTFYPAATLCFVVCGMAPGLVMVGLSGIAGYDLIIGPQVLTQADPHGALATAVFVLTSAATGAVVRAQLLSRKRAESAAARELELRQIIEAAPIALVISSAGGTIRMANGNAERLFGYASAELHGLSMEGLVPPALRGRHAGLRANAMASMVSRQLADRQTLAGWRKDGTEFPVEIGLSRIDFDGERMVLAGVIDITARRAAELASRQRQEALEESNAELIRAGLRAEQATRAKSRFLAGMSHELRTPLNGILGYAELLRIEGGLNDTQAHRVEAMQTTGEYLLQMINSVLNLSEIEAEKVNLKAAMIDVRAVVQHCINAVSANARAKDIVLTWDVAADVPGQVVADPMRLRQVMLNLLGNAIKFTDRGTVEARLRVIGAAGAGARLLVEIVDTGRGIPADRRGALFQDFERLGADANGSIEGAGLGLAIAAQLVALMGGHIAHADNPGGGSVFSFELPLLPEDAARPTAEPEMIDPAPTPSARALRVLAVDDIAMNRDITSSFLGAAGHTVDCADGGEAAVAAAAAADYDVLLMDLRMPEVDGFEATRRIRALGGTRGRVPIVALTAHAFPEQIEECWRAGMVGHVAKPFTQAAVLAAVTDAVNPRHTKRRHGAAAPAVPTGATLPVIDVATFETSAAYLSPAAVATYLENIAASVETALRTLRTRDAGAPLDRDMIDTVHTLAGTVGMFGFVRLTAVARSFERAARGGLEETPALTADLSDALEVSLLETRHRLLAVRG